MQRCTLMWPSSTTEKGRVDHREGYKDQRGRHLLVALWAPASAERDQEQVVLLAAHLGRMLDYR